MEKIEVEDFITIFCSQLCFEICHWCKLPNKNHIFISYCSGILFL